MNKKITTMVIVFALLFCYFIPIKSVFANSSTSKLSVYFRGDNANYGKVQYSLDNGNSWNNITTNTENLGITVTGSNLRLKLVPNANYSVDYAGIELRLDEENITNVSTYGLESENGYAIDSNVSEVTLNNVEFRGGNQTTQQQGNKNAKVDVTVYGTDLEYERPWDNNACDFVFGINGGQMRYISKDEVNYMTSYDSIVGLYTSSDLNYSYNYNNEGSVTFNIKTQWDDVITGLYINNEYYETPQTKEELTQAFDPDFRGIRFDIANVPYAEKYIIRVEAKKATNSEKIMGNFGWTYDENTNEYSDDDKIPHGNLEFVKAEYNGVTYDTVDEVNAAGGTFEWKNANKTDDPYGEAMFPAGTELTMKLIPDAGYQLTEFNLNGMPFTPGTEAGVYTFTIDGGNWHLGANFTEVDNKVSNTSNNIKNGKIKMNFSGDDSFTNGTARLEVKDVTNLSENRIEDFTAVAEEDGYEINNYIDMSLYNVIYKGGRKNDNGSYQSWDTQVDNLENDASITLELNEDMSGKDVVLVHEKHEGNTITGYEIIDATYNADKNTITFKTNSFSNYAVASKDSSIKEYEVTDEQGNSIKFKEESGHEFHLNIIDYLSLSDDELAEAGITKEEFNEGISLIKDKTNKYGELVAFLEIRLTDENDNEIHEGPFDIKIKMTDAMKKYNAFKIIYVDSEDEFKTEEPITLTVDGNYLVGTINHLSTYAVTGTIESVPNTGDKIILYISVLGVSVISLAGLLKYRKKLKA